VRRFEEEDKRRTDEMIKGLQCLTGIDCPAEQVRRSALASERLRRIKMAYSLGGADNVVFDRTGNVFDPRSGDLLGSLTEGGAGGFR
jgi:hypothetical protein